MRLVHDTADWATAIAALPTTPDPPCRTVLVFNERVAHALRRELVSTNRTGALLGTRFLTPAAAAGEVLLTAGIQFRREGHAQRVLRVHRVLQGPVPLRHYPIQLLRSGGWDAAFARTIRDLEGACLRSQDLRSLTHEPLHDVAEVWDRLDASAPLMWSPERLLIEAAVVLAEHPSAWPFDGPVLATFGPGCTAAEARFALAIPDCELALLAARPLRATFLDRLERLFGSAAAHAIAQAPFDPTAKGAATQGDASERSVFAAFFLEPPHVLASADRPRSRGIDGTVVLEEHAGIEAEVEAAADWVVRQVLEHRTPLDRIAVVAPGGSQLPVMIGDRLRRLRAPGFDEGVATFVPGGRSVTRTSAGARALALARALREWLPAKLIAVVLPMLHAPATPSEPNAPSALSPRRAARLAFSLGTLGGSAADPSGALEWSARLAARREQLERRATSAHHADRDDAQLLADLMAIQPALTALGDLAARGLSNAPLSEIAPAWVDFLGVHVRLATVPGRPPFLPQLADALSPVATDPDLGAMCGSEAMEVIHDLIQDLREPEPLRFGDPAVYVGSIRSARGLSFDAVRVVGLSEGHWPTAPRDDAVVPDERRGPPLSSLPRTADRALDDVHDLALALRSARRAIACSFARFDENRSQREPSAAFLEIAAALGRPGAKGEPASPFPDLHALRRDAFAPARKQAIAFRKQWPISSAALHTRAARSRASAIPARWLPPLAATSGALDLDRIRASGFASLATEGLFDVGASLELPGLTAELPISASGLRELLRCPHLFLFQRVLRWRRPEDDARLGQLDALAYGTLLHAVVESFYRSHGAAFSARRGSIDAWRAEVDATASSAFAELLEHHPVLGDSVRAFERARLSSDLQRFVDAEWAAPSPLTFEAAEVAFGFDSPAPIELEGGRLFVRGFIDRIDVDVNRLVVRDLKTGRPHARRGKEVAPAADVDLQLGVYALVARAMARDRGLGLGAAYVYTGPHADRERAFVEDIGDLESAAKTWLALAEQLLRARAFPRTPREKDCQGCAFQPVCGESFHAGVDATLVAGAGPLPALSTHKRGSTS